MGDQMRQTDVDAVGPTSISHIVGQRLVVDQITVALDASQQDARRFDHSLMVGPPGCGKTSISHVIAQEMAAPFIEVLGQSISNIADLNALLLSAKEDGTIIFIDEAAELDKTLQVSLYLALDQQRILLNGQRKGSSPLSIPLADVTLLLATILKAPISCSIMAPIPISSIPKESHLYIILTKMKHWHRK